MLTGLESFDPRLRGLELDVVAAGCVQFWVAAQIPRPLYCWVLTEGGTANDPLSYVPSCYARLPAVAQ